VTQGKFQRCKFQNPICMGYILEFGILILGFDFLILEFGILILEFEIFDIGI
jgi:hypothetical protein